MLKIILMLLYSLQHQIQRCVSLGVSFFKIGPQKVVGLILEKMGLSLVVAITLQILQF